MTDIRDSVVDLIREVDPDGTLDLDTFGAVLGQRLAPQFEDLYAGEVQKFVVEWLTGVDMYSPADLADALVKHFRLDQEI
ncbi:hypothetical protein ACQP2Y_21215 [Actinoplanes sp. CA-051413]|uniref:hypothetical protein n=1 Tax=Actinoplanes sp. CA-051413 TaxID=3239899 RepID=UPI003D98DBF6